MSYRVGVIALQHESNTFLHEPTTLAHFQQDVLLTGEAVREKFAGTHHEVGGFFAGLADEGIEAVPVFAARALPFGPIAPDAANILGSYLTATLDGAGRLDGLLVAPHGAAVAEAEPDFDGLWLTKLRERFPRPFPIIGTLDLHANLSPRMVAACDALIAYRSNPHLDQHDRGREAARLMARTLRGEVRPVCAAAFPPLAANIERQATAEPHWRPLLELADDQLAQPGVLSNSLVYGFPYADVPEMGSAVVAVTDYDPHRADRLASELACAWWDRRADFAGELISVEDAVRRATSLTGPVCLLDMGDNVGGGSPGDGTILADALLRHRLGPVLVVIFDPESVWHAEAAGVGNRLRLRVGGKTDRQHGRPIEREFVVRGLSDGRFEESQVRHGGIRAYDQGRSAVVETADGLLTLLLTGRRMAPFSLGQLTSCGIDVSKFRAVVAKGVHAPVAAYAPVCLHLIRVNTPGVTTADMASLDYRYRRRPLYPFEPETVWPATS
jgi:microcystin degradation protein MlrC